MEELVVFIYITPNFCPKENIAGNLSLVLQTLWWNLNCKEYFKWPVSTPLPCCSTHDYNLCALESDTHYYTLCWEVIDIWMYSKPLLGLPFYPKKIFALNSPICYLSCACLFRQQFVRYLHIYLELKETPDSSEIISLPPCLEKESVALKVYRFL